MNFYPWNPSILESHASVNIKCPDQVHLYFYILFCLLLLFCPASKIETKQSLIYFHICLFVSLLHPWKHSETWTATGWPLNPSTSCVATCFLFHYVFVFGGTSNSIRNSPSKLFAASEFAVALETQLSRIYTKVRRKGGGIFLTGMTNTTFLRRSQGANDLLSVLLSCYRIYLLPYGCKVLPLMKPWPLSNASLNFSAWWGFQLLQLGSTATCTWRKPWTQVRRKNTVKGSHEDSDCVKVLLTRVWYISA